MVRDSRTARLAVVAAALALSGFLLAAWARGSATYTVDGARAETEAAAQRLGSLLSTAIVTARARAEGLAATPLVRAAIETDVATVRDMARTQGFVLTPAAHEVVEIYQVTPHRRPLSLLRAPETSQTLAIKKARETRIDERGGALVVTVAVPSQPLYAHGAVKGAVAVATRVDLAPLTASLAPSGVAAELIGVGEPVALTMERSPEGAQAVTAPVPLAGGADDPAPPRLTLRASVRAGGGLLLWAGRTLLVAALLAALWAFVAYRRAMPALDDAPTARRDTRLRSRVRKQANAPGMAIEAAPTTKERRSDVVARSNANRLVLAWSADMPTPITQLKPTHESVPILDRSARRPARGALSAAATARPRPLVGRLPRAVVRHRRTRERSRSRS